MGVKTQAIIIFGVFFLKKALKCPVRRNISHLPSFSRQNWQMATEGSTLLHMHKGRMWASTSCTRLHFLSPRGFSSTFYSCCCRHLCYPTILFLRPLPSALKRRGGGGGVGDLSGTWLVGQLRIFWVSRSTEPIARVPPAAAAAPPPPCSRLLSSSCLC